jgi:flagellar hook assembly protein FlgD
LIRPNPSRAAADLRFGLETAGHVEAVIYDSNGRALRRLADAALSAGVHELRWDGRTDTGEDVASGVYFVRAQIRAGGSARELEGRIVITR